MTKFSVSFAVEGQLTVEVDAPDTATKADIIKMLNQDMIWDAVFDYNSDLARDTLTDYKCSDNPEQYFYVFNDDSLEEVN